MYKIFIDLGFYQGNALKIYREKGMIDKTWKVYAFEPSPTIGIEDKIKNHPEKIKLIKKAAWTEDGTVDFLVGGRDDASSVKGTSPHGEPLTFSVGSVDFSRFVSELPEAFIVCSMDIEGSEYPVLEKLLEEGTIDKIDLLDVEFHHRLLSDKTQEDSQALIDRLITRTAVKLKVALI